MPVRRSTSCQVGPSFLADIVRRQNALNSCPISRSGLFPAQSSTAFILLEFGPQPGFWVGRAVAACRSCASRSDWDQRLGLAGATCGGREKNGGGGEKACLSRWMDWF